VDHTLLGDAATGIFDRVSYVDAELLGQPEDNRRLRGKHHGGRLSDLPKAAKSAISTGCGVGIDALGSPIGAATMESPLMMHRVSAEEGRRHSTRSASLPFSTEPISLRRHGHRGVDGIFRDVALTGNYVVCCVLRERAALLFIRVPRMPGQDARPREPTHGLFSISRDITTARRGVQDVFPPQMVP